jgi:prevent-host-death family protein
MSAFEARRSFGQALERVARGERVVVEKHGRAVAVMVPVEIYDQWVRSRGEFFARLRTASGDLSERPSNDTRGPEVAGARTAALPADKRS